MRGVVSECAWGLAGRSGGGEDGMIGDGGGKGVAGRGVLGQSPFDPAHERAQAQVAASVQVQPGSLSASSRGRHSRAAVLGRMSPPFTWPARL